MGIFKKKTEEVLKPREWWTELITAGQVYTMRGTQEEVARKVIEAKRRKVWLVAQRDLVNPHSVIAVGESYFYKNAMGGIEHGGPDPSRNLPLE
jgi:hypothetical protein